MAKAKDKEVKEPVVEEKVEEIAEDIPTKEEIIEAPTAKADSFLNRKLKAVNSLENPLKAQRIANRLLRKRR